MWKKRGWREKEFGDGAVDEEKYLFWKLASRSWEIQQECDGFYAAVPENSYYVSSAVGEILRKKEL